MVVLNQQWILGLVSALGIKLSSSIDDVVWLAPFLTSNSSASIIFQNSVIYTTVCLVQTLVAMAIAYSGRAAVQAATAGNPDAWSTEKILTVGAGTMLALYSIKLTYEYFTEEEEGEESPENVDPEGGTYNKVATNEAEGEDKQYESGRGRQCCCASPADAANGADMGKSLSARSREMVPPVEIDSPDKAQEDVDKADRSRQQTLFVIAFIGSVDDLTLFVPMLVGKGFDLVQLMVGAFIATSMIVMLCVFIGMCKPIADCLARIPLALIVICFASVLLFKGLVLPDEGKESS